MENIKAIIFDMDGVLVDSEPIHEKVEIQTCREFGIDLPEKKWDNFRGKKLAEIFSYLSKKYGKGDEPIDEMIERKVELYLERALKDMEMISGAGEFLEKVKEDDNFSYMLTTSGTGEQQEKILEKFGLTESFPERITAEDVVKGKPDPEPYLKSVERLSLPAENCLVIEDSYNGILSAKAAGCQACGLSSSYFSKKQLEEAGADLVISEFKELEEKLF